LSDGSIDDSTPQSKVGIDNCLVKAACHWIQGTIYLGDFCDELLLDDHRNFWFREFITVLFFLSEYPLIQSRTKAGIYCGFQLFIRDTRNSLIDTGE
jgi:hypothetical protein